MHIPLLYILSFWAFMALGLHHKAKFKLGPLCFAGLFGLFHVLGIFLCYGTIYFGSALAWVLLLPVISLHRTWRELRPYVWLVALTVVCIPLLYVVPLAETDSVGYMLPMADGARTYSTIGHWYTDADRAVRRFWGLAAHACLYLNLTGGRIAGVCVVVLPGFVGFLHLTALLGRVLRIRSPLLTTLLLFTSPVIFTNLLSLKDDILFVTTALFLCLLLRYRKRAWQVLAWFSIITSKLFYPLVGLLVIPLAWRYRQLRVTILAGVAALAIVLLVNWPRASVTGYPWSNWRAYPVMLSGATPAELGLKTESVTPKSVINPPTFTVRPPAGEAIFLTAKEQWRLNAIYHSIGMFTIASRHVNEWWRNGIWYPNYAPLVFPLFLSLLGFLSWQRYRRIWVLACALFLAGFFLILQVPSFNHVRYLFIPITILTCLGSALVPRLVLLALVLVQTGLVSAILFTPSVTQAFSFWLAHGRPPFALEVQSNNPTLYVHKQFQLQRSSQEVLLAVSTTATAGQYLITDSSHGTIIDTTARPGVFELMVNKLHPTTILVTEDLTSPDEANHPELRYRLGQLGYIPDQDAPPVFSYKKK